MIPKATGILIPNRVLSVSVEIPTEL